MDKTNKMQRYYVCYIFMLPDRASTSVAAGVLAIVIF